MARPAKFERDVILDRAMRTFWVRGWSSTSIRDLEGAIGVKAPALYRRFGSKDGLTLAVVDHYVDRVVGRRIARHLTGTGDPISNLGAFFESAVTPPDSGAPLVGCLLTTLSTEHAHVDPAVQHAVDRGVDEIDRAVRSELRRAEATGRLAPGLAVDDAAATLALAWHGLMVLARGGTPPAELQARAAAAITSIARRPTDARDDDPDDADEP